MKFENLILTAAGLAASISAAGQTIETPASLFDSDYAIYNRSASYASVKVNGVEVPVMDGYDRSGDYLEYDVVRYTSTPGKNRIEITCASAVNSASVSPKMLDIEIENPDSRTIAFDVPDPADCPYYLYARINGRNLVIIRDEPYAIAAGANVWNIGELLKSAGIDATKQANAGKVAALVQKALDEASEYGTSHSDRGVVFFPGGLYYMGNVVIKSNTEMNLDIAAAIRATDNRSDYKVDYHKNSLGRDGTWWISTVNDVNNPSKNVKISGRGVIDANGYYYQKRLANNAERFCITALHVIHAEDVEIDGVTVMQTPMWGTMLGRSNDIAVTNVKFFNSTDANENDCIDVNECQRVVVDRSIGIALDDPYSTKTWMGQELFLNWTGEPEILDDVTFNHCVSWSYCGAFKMGHGAQQKQTNVNILNSVVLNSGRAIGIEPKYGNDIPDISGFHHVLVENVDIENAGGEGWLKILATTPDIGNPPIKDITLRNVNIRSKGSASSLRGLDDDNIVDGVKFENIFLYGNERPVTSLAELNITNTGFCKNIVFTQAEEQAAEYTLEAEYFNANTSGSVKLFADADKNPALKGAFVQGISTGTHLKYNDVDFGSNTASMTLYAMARHANFKIELRLDAPDGKLIGTAELLRGSEMKELDVSLDGASGIHDLYVVFTKKSGGSSVDRFDRMVLKDRTYANLESIVLPVREEKLNVEMSMRLNPQLIPANAYQNSLSYSILEGEEFISLDKEGLIRGLKPGVARVRVSSVDFPEIYDECKVMVVDEVEFECLRLEAEDADEIYDTYHFDSPISAGDVKDPEEVGGKGLNSCWHGNFAIYRDFDFKSGAVKAVIRKGYPRGSRMEIWIDPVVDKENKSFSGGTKIVDIEFPAAGTDWNRWQTFEAPVTEPTAGVHTIAVRFLAGGGSAENQNYGSLNWIDFLTAGEMSAAEGVASDAGLRVSVEDCDIILESGQPCGVDIFTVDGRRAATLTVEGAARAEGLQRGLYIVAGRKVLL